MAKRRAEPQTRYDPSAPRTSRREQLRQQRRRRSLIFNIIILGTLALFLGLVAVFVFASQRPGPLPGETQIPDEGAAVYPEGQELTYQHYPPSSGPRYAESAPWGLSDEPVPEGRFVANLARGGVVFLFNCPEAECPELEQQFRDLIERAEPDRRFNQVKILAAPYERDLETPVVALAWGHQMNLAEFDEDLLLRWYRRFVNQGGPAIGP